MTTQPGRKPTRDEFQEAERATIATVNKFLEQLTINIDKANQGDPEAAALLKNCAGTAGTYGTFGGTFGTFGTYGCFGS